MRGIIDFWFVLLTDSGSIGSELSRQVAKNNPKKLILFDVYENRDLAIAVTFGVSLWMYATPVVYPLSTAGEGVITLGGVIWSVVFTVIVLLGGMLLFNRVEKTFMDTV